eukprot:scaffold505_cov245-Ochromonas_danica.AAC.4
MTVVRDLTPKWRVRPRTATSYLIVVKGSSWGQECSDSRGCKSALRVATTMWRKVFEAGTQLSNYMYIL